MLQLYGFIINLVNEYKREYRRDSSSGNLIPCNEKIDFSAGNNDSIKDASNKIVYSSVTRAELKRKQSGYAITITSSVLLFDC